ncbi:TerC family protein [Ancylobacter sp. 6x-1]|uniref:TerC family protein n=1 Tax=Ancylobacter crimeensis TaxID=2579147 RepID=A0ABT0DCI8_9HYPH|nr:TerC family protein [Ancylobacter crimeensis]MCK0197671.1 TerC family protein [Ancylobacter crimeensis]
MLDLLTSTEAWAALLTLTAMEIVLGIDNIVFISLLVSRLDPQRGEQARRVGLALALVFRIGLLTLLSWVIGLTEPVFSLAGRDFSWRDLVLIAGGLFLIAKSTGEIHTAIAIGEEGEEEEETASAGTSFWWIVAQVVGIDLVFSVDSIITAIGMAQDLPVMIAAVVVAVGIMYLASGAVARFIAAYPTTKMLALSFLLLIGMSLIADGFGVHVPRAYIYSAMAFSAVVEIFNVTALRRARRRRASRVKE